MPKPIKPKPPQMRIISQLDQDYRIQTSFGIAEILAFHTRKRWRTLQLKRWFYIAMGVFGFLPVVLKWRNIKLDTLIKDRDALNQMIANLRMIGALYARPVTKKGDVLGPQPDLYNSANREPVAGPEPSATVQ